MAYSKIWEKVNNFLSAAIFWFGFGLKVIPIVPRTKRTTVQWDDWLDNLKSRQIVTYWEKNPNHEVGCIVGDDLLVFDADTPESLSALVQLETLFGFKPKLVVKTAKGQHHYFRRTPEIRAKSDSHDSIKHPELIDIKTDRALVILPNSSSKSVHILTAENKEELTCVSQLFLDVSYEHNGRTAPSETRELSFNQSETNPASLQKLESLLKHISPDVGYEDWLRVGMAVYHETSGSEEGMAQYDRWSSGGKKYKGIKDIQAKWRSFSTDVKAPVTIGTLVMLAKNAGADVATFMDDAFKICEFEVIEPDTDKPKKNLTRNNPLDKYSLLGMSGEIEKKLLDEVYVLGEIALLGQKTVFYAAPNTGKTLLTIYMLTESIREGKIDPTKVYYINVDDTSRGIHEKLQIAEEYGFHMLAEGYKDFKVSEFYNLITLMIESGETQGVIIVLDTLKKFTDLMSKKLCTQFGKIIRRFVMKGGTVISLAHVNKNPGQDGKPIHAGTTDIVEDSDCVYMLTTVSEDSDESNQKVVEFTNRKNRGNVTLSAAYSYSLERDISYNELLLSVEKVDGKNLETVIQDAEMASDAKVISAIENCITEGINTKMKLTATVADRVDISRKNAINIIEKYTGSDPAIHRWSFEVRYRGAKVYEMLNSAAESPAESASEEF